MCASVVAAFRCFIFVCMFQFFRVCFFFGCTSEVWCSQTPVMSLNNTPNHNLMQDKAFPICCSNCMLSKTKKKLLLLRLLLGCWTLYAWQFEPNNLWDAFVWFPISSFSNTSDNWVQHFCEHLNSLLRKIYHSQNQPSDASSGLLNSLICSLSNLNLLFSNLKRDDPVQHFTITAIKCIRHIIRTTHFQ